MKRGFDVGQLQRLKMDRVQLSEETVCCLKQMIILERTKEENEEKELWEHCSGKLHAFSPSNGGDANFPVNNDDSSNKKQYKWAFREGLLSDDRARRLKATGLDFDWTSRLARSNATYPGKDVCQFG